MSEPDDGSDDGLDRLRQVEWLPVGEDFWDEAEPVASGPSDDGDADLDDPAAAGDGDGPPVGEKGFDLVRIPRAMHARLTLPVNCPVTPLGVLDDKFFYLDRIGQLRRIPAEKHGQNTIKSLFGDTKYLIATWPRAKEDGEGGWIATGWKPEEPASALMDKCISLGVFDPDEKVRGAGAWKGADGELIVHFGKGIGVWPGSGGAPMWYAPCVIGDHIYPTRPPLPFPAKEPGKAKDASHRVLHHLMSWNWARPDVDPCLLLDRIVASFLGASLKWHPLFWAVGDKGTGKSTLLLMIKCLLGRFLLSTGNASAAYIYQKVGQDSRAVGIDEAEPDEESKRLSAQLELARAAASGVAIGRGGQEGTPVEFTQRAPYIFCSINMPGLNGADLSRIAVGILKELGGDLSGNAIMPPEDEREMERVMGVLGRQLLRRVVDGWHRLPAILKAYRTAMKAAGHSGRGADVFGTQLACAHLVLHDEMPTEAELADWGRRMKADELAELSTDMAANRACLLHLQSSLLEAKKGGQSYTAGYWITRLRENSEQTAGDASAAKDVREILRASGLDVKPAPKPKDVVVGWSATDLYLWVAYRHQGVARLFADSAWKARSNTAGSWVRQLSSLDGAIANASFFCDGAQDKAVLIPISYCSELIEDPSASGRAPVQTSDPDPSSTEASDRSEADTSSSPSAAHTHSPDPFALTD